MQVRIAGFVPESYTDGSGIRFAVFMQGYLHYCKGCHNPAAQPLNGGCLINTAEIISALKQNPLLGGITLTGGEPFLQIDAANELTRATKALRLSVWCYTGFMFEEILPHWLENIDVLVDGAFIENLRDLELQFSGSGNQRIIDVKKSLERGAIVIITLF